MGIWGRLLQDRSLRPDKRSNSLISMANSLALIARALKIIVQREYHIDIDAPEPSRADRTLEVFEPMYADNVSEAVREERERITRAELDEAATGNGRRDAAVKRVALTYEADGGDESGRSSSEELTPEEVRFLAELDTDGDER